MLSQRSHRIFTGEDIRIRVTGFKWPDPTTISVRGQFVIKDRVEVQDFYIHRSFRDISSLLGLALIAILWFTAAWKKRNIRIDFSQVITGSKESMVNDLP